MSAFEPFAPLVVAMATPAPAGDASGELSPDDMPAWNLDDL